MKFVKPLLVGTLLQRYKRFFADVEYEGEKITIHVPNTGSLKGVIEKNTRQECWFSLHGDESKKLKGTLEAIQAANGTWVGVNTSNPNKIVQEAIRNLLANEKSHFPHWDGYRFYKSEYKISEKTRLDGVFCLTEDDLHNPKSKKHYIEIKNTTFSEQINGEATALFPDAVTERGQKHLREMMELLDEGHKAEIIFTVQRDDVTAFAAAKEIDPEYAKLLSLAKKKGLIISPVLVGIDRNEVLLTRKMLKFTEI